MNANSTPFVAQKNSLAFKQAQQAVTKTSTKKQAPVKPHHPNQQLALSFNKIVYTDILFHNLHVSVQEYQKKMKMFQKKVTKKKFMEYISPPEIQYMNIYSSSLKRLNCFEEVTNKFDREQDHQRLFGGFNHACHEELEEEYEGGYFFGDA